jgi:hypothetical protein
MLWSRLSAEFSGNIDALRDRASRSPRKIDCGKSSSKRKFTVAMCAADAAGCGACAG